MRLSKRIERYLRTPIDFYEFRLLAVLPQTKTDAVVLLVPRTTGANRYCNMKCQDGSRWFCSVDQMLDECIQKGYVGRISAALLKKASRRERV